MLKTYQKKTLKASCLQWTGGNKEDFKKFCLEHGMTVRQQEQDWLLLWSPKEGIIGVGPQQWVVVQEDSEVRVYSDQKFKHIYEEVEG